MKHRLTTILALTAGLLPAALRADEGAGGHYVPGATRGDFEGRTAGVCPVISFITKVGKADLAMEVKWLPELNVEKRLKGDTVWFKIGVVF